MTSRPSDAGFRPALLLMSARALASAFTFVIPVVLARALEPAEFGAYKQVFLLYGTLYVLGQLGMAESLYYFLPLHPERGGRLVANAAAVLAVAGVVGVVLLAVAREPVAALVGNERLAPELPLVGGVLAAMLVSSVLEIALVARRRYAAAAAAYIGTDVLRTALIVVPVLCGAGLRGLLLGALAAAVVRIAFVAVLLRREFRDDRRLDRPLLRLQLAYALPFALAVGVEIVQATLHQWVVSYRFDAATFALYSIGCLQIPLVDLLANPAANVMMVRMADAHRRGDRPAVLAGLEETTRKLALVFLPLFVLLVVLARDVIVFLFGERYAGSAPIFRLWCVTVLLAIVPTDALMRVLAETRYLFATNVARLVLVAALIGPLLAGLGLRGPVLVTLGGLALAKAMMLVRWKSRLAVPLRVLLPWGALLHFVLAAGGAGAVASMIAAAIDAPPLARLVVVTTAFGAVYVALLVATGALTADERLALSFRRGTGVAGDPRPA